VRALVAWWGWIGGYSATRAPARPGCGASGGPVPAATRHTGHIPVDEVALRAGLKALRRVGMSSRAWLVGESAVMLGAAP
jgi:hypothetical protein